NRANRFSKAHEDQQQARVRCDLRVVSTEKLQRVWKQASTSMVQGKGDLQMNSPRNICPLPLQPLPPGKGREETKERTTAGLHSLFARRIPQSYILKLLDRDERNAIAQACTVCSPGLKRRGVGGLGSSLLGGSRDILLGWLRVSIQMKAEARPAEYLVADVTCLSVR